MRHPIYIYIYTHSHLYLIRYPIHTVLFHILAKRLVNYKLKSIHKYVCVCVLVHPSVYIHVYMLVCKCIDIYLCVCVCVLVCVCLSTPLHVLVIFMWCLTIHSFHTKGKEPSLRFNFTQSRRENSCIHTFPKGICVMWNAN